jgi:hypothetical protein
MDDPEFCTTYAGDVVSLLSCISYHNQPESHHIHQLAEDPAIIGGKNTFALFKHIVDDTEWHVISVKNFEMAGVKIQRLCTVKKPGYSDT